MAAREADLFAPIGQWKWNHASGTWDYYAHDELIWQFTELSLVRDRGRAPKDEPFIEVIDGTFMNTLVIRRIYKDNPDSIRDWLKSRGIELTEVR